MALALAVSRALYQPEFSDEQIFVGGAGMVARGQGVVYRDFFYTHMPAQLLLLAAIFRATDQWLLAARLLDACCGAALATLIFEATRRAARNYASTVRVALAAAVAGMFLFNPLTADAVGKAWNHDLAALACVAGYLVLVRGLSVASASPARWAFASGALAAIGATTRLTFLPPMIGFVLLILIAPGRDVRQRFRLLGGWSLGALLAAAPTLYLILQAPFSAHFGSFRYPHYAAMYHARATVPSRLLLASKFTYAWNTIKPSLSLLILLASTIAAVAIGCRPRRATLRQAAFVGLLAMLAAASVSAFMPTPMFRQYLYGPLPFAALAIGWAAPLARIGSRRWPAMLVFFVAAAIAIVASVKRYDSVAAYRASPASWTPMQTHADAARLVAFTHPGARALTLAPATALEGGLTIYPKLSMGRYGLRVGELLSPSTRARVKLPTYQEIDGWFVSDPPDVVLLVEPQTPDEQKLIEIARKHGYWRRYFGKNKIVYLPPSTRPPNPKLSAVTAPRESGRPSVVAWLDTRDPASLMPP